MNNNPQLLTELFPYPASLSLNTQIPRLKSSRLIGTNDPKFAQWKGRIVCLLKSLETLVREPFRMVKNATLFVARVVIIAFNLLNEQFSHAFNNTYDLGKFAITIALQPICMIKEFGHYAFGAFIHPKFVIKTLSNSNQFNLNL
ncbi:MAG: hypothetical protein VX777_06065 [Chlamydiota bacterium]|nr:hypothetical protein [Chlamydiota bacterium]